MSRDLFYKNPKFNCSSTPSETPQEEYDRRLGEVLAKAKEAWVYTLADENTSLKDDISRLNRQHEDYVRFLRNKEHLLSVKDQQLSVQKQELSVQKQQLSVQKQQLLDKDKEIAELEGYLIASDDDKTRNSDAFLRKKKEIEAKKSLSKFVEYPWFENKTWQEQVKIFADIMKSEKLVDVSEQWDFYKISITIPLQWTTDLLVSKDEFITDDRIDDEKNIETHEKAKNMWFNQIDKSDAFGLSEKLLELFDKLWDNKVNSRVENADWFGSSSKWNSIWAFFVRFIYDVIHNSKSYTEQYGYDFSHLWLKNVWRMPKYNSVSNFAIMRYSKESQD